MFDSEKQIKYWTNTALDDLETVDILFDKNKYKESLFFCHLSIEKILKALYVKAHNDFAPKTHKLSFLASQTKLKLDDDIQNLFGILMTFQLEGRYPDYNPQIPSRDVIAKYILQTKEAAKWLTAQL